MLLPGALTRRRALIVLIAPVLALVALAALDLATAHGSGHYTGSILHARSAGDLRDVIVRRYSAAFGELHNHAMPVATLLALLCAISACAGASACSAPSPATPPGWPPSAAASPRASSARSSRTPARSCSSSPSSP